MGYQGMVCLAGNQVWWTWEVEDVFRKVQRGMKHAMKEYAKKQHRQIDDLVVQVRQLQWRIQRGNVPPDFRPGDSHAKAAPHFFDTQ